MGIKKTYIILIALFFTQAVFAQTLTDEEDEYVLNKDSLTVKDKMTVHTELSMGAGVFNNGSFISTSIRPVVSYQVSPRFSVYSGIGYTNYQLDNFRMLSDFGYVPFSGNLSQMTAFVGGKYQLNDRWVVGGEVSYNFLQFTPDGMSATANSLSAIDRVGYAAYFQYKVSDNLYIEGEVRINKFNSGSNFYDPMQNHGFGSGAFMRQSSGINTMPFSR